MRWFLLLVLFLVADVFYAQGFECDGSLFLITYEETEGVSILYKGTAQGVEISYDRILLSEERRLSGLAYNTADKYLYAMDNDTYELIRIASNGDLLSLGRPINYEPEHTIKSGTFSPNGNEYYVIRHIDSLDLDDRFYKIDLFESSIEATFNDISRSRESEICDFAVDPISGTLYGFENVSGRLVQMGVAGQIAALNFSETGINDMDGVFFNADGELYGYSASSGFYSIDLNTGEASFLSRGPVGSLGDACSCPYTYSFTKEVVPKQIIPCEDFEVIYTFQNRMGIQQSFKSVVDTFPEGFEILDFDSQVAFNSNVVESDDHIMSFDKVSFLMRNSQIKLTVRPPTNYEGTFESRARVWSFPIAFGENYYSDDPDTDLPMDATSAIVVSPDDVMFEDSLIYSCNGDVVTLSAPLPAESYNWNTGSTNFTIDVDEPGWYSLVAQSACLRYEDSIFVDKFLMPKSLEIIGPTNVSIGSIEEYRAVLSRGNAMIYDWEYRGEDISCDTCSIIRFVPTQSGFLNVTLIDEEGCNTMGSLAIEVDPKRDFYAANSFSPNNDNINDVFFLQSSSAGLIRKWSIFNRWGNEVFQDSNIPINNPSQGWTGVYKNELLHSDVFIWTAEIEFADGQVESFAGTVSLFTVE